MNDFRIFIPEGSVGGVTSPSTDAYCGGALNPTLVCTIATNR